MSATQALPDVVDFVAPILARVPREHRPLVIALAERLAADRYRGWAEASEDLSARAELQACADREDEIASRVESLYPDAAEIQAGILAENPDLEDLNRSMFGGRPILDQYTIQAQGERIGAGTWRSFARHSEPPARDVFLACAELEEASAIVLERMLSETR